MLQVHRPRRRPLACVLALVSSGALFLAGALPAHAVTYGAPEVLSVPQSGAEGDGGSEGPTVSGDARYVAFTSDSSTLVPGDRNGRAADVVLTDLATGSTRIVSRSSTGVQGNRSSLNAVVSRDGRVVAYRSRATNLVAGDTNATEDVFVTDRVSGTTRRVSVATGGRQGTGDSGIYLALSAQGRFVAFTSFAADLVPGDTNGEMDVFLHDVETGTTTRVGVGQGGRQPATGAYDLALSGDGRTVAFCSTADGLVPGDADGALDLFVRDRVTATTTRVTAGARGLQGSECLPSLSRDGRFLAFEIGGAQQPLAVLDRSSGALARGPLRGGVSLSDDGRWVLGVDGRPGRQLTLWDRVTRTSSSVGRAPDGSPADNQLRVAAGGASLSSDGRRVVYDGFATNLTAGNTVDQSDVFTQLRR